MDVTQVTARPAVSCSAGLRAAQLERLHLRDYAPTVKTTHDAGWLWYASVADLCYHGNDATGGASCNFKQSATVEGMLESESTFSDKNVTPDGLMISYCKLIFYKV
jgi:hypothetical protein